MIEYSRLEIVDAKEVDMYLNKGWQIIETSKSTYPEGDTLVKYHVGYPTSRFVDDLKSIIKEYENRGFKDKLFEEIATENSENINDYDTRGFYTVRTPLTKFMENYELIVNNKTVHFYKEPAKKDYEEFDF
ncbi:hypothetical protein [Bacillus infantis]|uniref:hypothetical protein n=1 Tax=Bacillus infantis TaxID=324767 RepID=UPI0021557923|nr:hypothetical protein [Bacillus infantis]MCR6610618.1 hypothetical protein [Bacillus infantis]